MQKLKEWRGRSISRFKKLFSAYNYLLIYFFLLITFDVVLLNFPLTNYLGYEFSILNSALIIFLSGIFTISFLKKNTVDAGTVKYIYKTIVLISLIFLIIPFIISLYSLFKTIICPLKDGIIFYTFFTLPAPVIGIALGVLSFSISKRFGFIFFLLSLFIICLIPVFEIYFNPQIYFYNPIIGFFPGTIYDESIEVDIKLMIYRMMNLIFFTSVIVLVLRALVTNSKSLLNISWTYTLVGPVAFIILSPYFGYSTTDGRIYNELDRTITSEHYELHYSSEINDTLIRVIALHQEFYYSELEKFFNVKLKKKIISFIFSDREQKKKLFGTENADVAKPWIPEIYILADNYDKTLRHEIAHCFAGEFGSRVFKVADNFNPALIEGIAMAADPDYDSFDLDYMAALAFDRGFTVDIKTLFSFFNFFKQPSSIGYIVAGSFIKFIIDRYGIERFKNLYANLDFPKYYNKQLSELSSEFEFYLKNKFVVSESVNDRAKYYYGRKSIFYKICPRYVAKKLNEAWKLYDQKKIGEAKGIFNELKKNSDNYSALIGLSYCYVELQQYQKAIDILKGNLHKFENTPYYYEVELILADLLIKNGQIDEAKALYDLLIKQNPSRILYGLTALRNDLLNTGLVTTYLNAKDNEKYEILKLLNSKKYNYNSFPYLVLLAKSSNIEYGTFLKNFLRTFEVKNFNSSYGIYKLSLYMCEKMDFDRSRKLAALSLRFSEDSSFNSVLKSNFEKMDWLYKNYMRVLSSVTFH